MKAFMDKNFLLSNATAKYLYHHYAKEMPIFDFHCHLPADEIANDQAYENVSQMWLGHDHYKWRAMRSFGIEERLITGDASDEEKFLAFANMMPYLVGNPIYHWSHLELQRYFGIKECLNGDNALRIYKKCNDIIKKKHLTARKLIMMSKVAFIGTTDDPADSLEYHKQIAADTTFPCKVAPSFRPDRAIKILKEDFADYITQLGASAHTEIKDYSTLLKVLENRLDYFVSLGATVTDHSLERVSYEPSTFEEVTTIFEKAIQHQPITLKEANQYVSATLVALGKMYAKRKMVMQLHVGALRNNNSRMFAAIGADTGFDSIDDGEVAVMLSRLLDKMDESNELPKTILYCLNPKDNEVMASMIGNFQGGGVAGKVQFGSGWWFNDQKDGMNRQLTSLSQLGLLSQFVGMLTDSRSFLSYTRHEYFRRILCDFIGKMVENGEYPRNLKFLGSVVEDVCFNNAAKYFSGE